MLLLGFALLSGAGHLFRRAMESGRGYVTGIRSQLMQAARKQKPCLTCLRSAGFLEVSAELNS